ncbi:GNAT family N-acetyltransferase [Vibrio sp. 99-70-13A1]|uniref:GNAT family N-acetyltransferase n=1 Tax=Vibrio sp. 99-70-13A1 TaxID=2607601 RepID=UPI001493D9F0|nr:GNAT family N-acetyltransferase [Vibrio sp. 99-70-13A1]NOH96063.1 GNAT family N-acetyltransferase [Vibrio sp. 99-70-13A1]
MEVIIRPAQVSDAQGLCDLYSQPNAQRETLQLPNSSPKLWIDRLSNIPTGVYSYVAEVEGKIVGNIGFQQNQRPRNQHMASFGMGVHDDFSGLGIGSKLLETVIELADNWLNVHRIHIEAHCDNERAIALYKKFGFEIEGEAKDNSFRDGEFVNTYYLARIRPSK